MVAVFSFMAGAAIGAAVSWKFATEKYKLIAQEEIDSVKEAFAKLRSEKVESEPNNEDISDRTRCKEIVGENGYSNEKGEQAQMIKPYVISPDEFGEGGYPTVSLTYYDDKVLTDEADEPIVNIDEVVGEESLTHFGEYEDDSVFVRNDDLKLDFEILLDVRNHSDVANSVMRRV